MATASQSAHLPAPSAEALALSAELTRLIADEIGKSGGWIPFARYMELALYAPGLGYYMAGARKLGRDGDFVTAPEISALYGRTLARQVQEIARDGLSDVLEIGAGSGTLAADLLVELEKLGALPQRYLILELSPDLRSRSRNTLAARAPHLLERVAWLNGLPPAFEGVVIANEVLDAMPARVCERDGKRIIEMGVAVAGGKFEWAPQPSGAAPAAIDASCFPVDGYRSEFQHAACGFVRSLGGALAHGAALFVDYGFPRGEYYHPQRSTGTLMCHYRHRAHDDPFYLPGLQDLSAHVDFTAVAEAGIDAGLNLLGYTTQAHFLVNSGIIELLGHPSADAAIPRLTLTAGVQKLLSPAEMGELFKVIALGRGIDGPLIGFASGDKSRLL